jgi:hypothetical protein
MNQDPVEKRNDLFDSKPGGRTIKKTGAAVVRLAPFLIS